MWRRYSSMGKERMSVPSTSDGPFGHVVEAADEVDQRGLARAAGPDQADHLARLDRQVDALDHGAVAVAEADVAELDPALQSRPGWHGMHRLGHGGLAVEDAEDPLGRGGRPLHRRDECGSSSPAGRRSR